MEIYTQNKSAMTLQEFFDVLTQHPIYIIAFFVLIPLTAFIGSIIGEGEEDSDAWKYFYSMLIYLVAVPGIFSVTLNIYLLIFERRSILEADVFTQVLPILSMIATLLIIRRTANLEHIPGF